MNWKNLLPHVIAVVVMALVSIAYVSPVLEGKTLVQSDIISFKANSNEIQQYREEYDEEPLWTTRVFSGMTTFIISTAFESNIIQYIRTAAMSALPKPADTIFFLCFGFYILLIALGVNPWIALAGAVGYGLSSNLLISLMVGHNTKVLSIAFAAPALAGLILTFRGKYFMGSFLTLLFVGLLINANHFQIMYYFILMGIFLGVVEFIFAMREKRLPGFWRATALVLVCGALAVAPNFSKIYNIYEHGKQTMRGGDSELSSKGEDEKGGLDLDYAMSWSYSPLETFTLIVPSATGGASTESLPEDGEVAEALDNYNLNRQQKERILANAPTYVGEQPFTMGPIYIGAAFVFLFIFALFALNRRDLWIWAVAVTLLSIFIAWGRHFLIFTGFLFDYLPLYNKFRTPSMALAIAGIAVPFLGVLGLNAMAKQGLSTDRFRNAFKWGVYVSGGIMLVLLLYGLSSDWIGSKDAQFQVENSPWAIEEIYEALIADRKAMFLSDWTIGLLFMAMTAGAMFFYQRNKISLPILVAVLAVTLAGDAWRVSKRYLNNDNFASEKRYESNFVASAADQSILKDPDPHYRVINLSKNPWTDAETSYWHENVGGYHPAKLQRYQDLIEHQLSPQLQLLQSALRQNGNQIMVDPQAAGSLTAFNMLNTKYFILQPENPNGFAINPTALGNAWFVRDVKKVASADEEMAAIGNTNVAETAIVHEEFAEELWNREFTKAPSAYIELTEFTPNYLAYKSSNAGEGLAVFSEVYYPMGWNAFIDGEPVETYRVNYLLRALVIPPGEHEIEMVFEPETYTVGETVSLAGSILFVLFGGSMLFLYFRNRKEDL